MTKLQAYYATGLSAEEFKLIAKLLDIDITPNIVTDNTVRMIKMFKHLETNLRMEVNYITPAVVASMLQSNDHKLYKIESKLQNIDKYKAIISKLFIFAIGLILFFILAGVWLETWLAAKLIVTIVVSMVGGWFYDDRLDNLRVNLHNDRSKLI